MFFQDIETERNMKVDEHVYQDIKDEIPHSKILATNCLISKVKLTVDSFYCVKCKASVFCSFDY